VLVLSAFARASGRPAVDARPITPGHDLAFADRDGKALGIEARAVPLSGRPPPYMRFRGEPTDPARGDTIALVVWATGSTKRVLYAPGVAAIGEELETEAARSDVLLVDGTCFSNEETSALVGRTAADMGHMTIAPNPGGGDDGTLAWLQRHPRARRIYVHINNTNPVLSPGSPERREVLAAGVEIGEDGVELVV